MLNFHICFLFPLERQERVSPRTGRTEPQMRNGEFPQDARAVKGQRCQLVYSETAELHGYRRQISSWELR